MKNGYVCHDLILTKKLRIKLSKADWELFTNHLKNPPAPNDKLKEAMKRYYERK